MATVRELWGRGAESEWSRTERSESEGQDQEGGTYGKGSTKWVEGNDGIFPRGPLRDGNDSLFLETGLLTSCH